MITQVFYMWHPCGQNVWSTTYSNNNYSVESRKHLITRVKPVDSVVRHLHKQQQIWVVKL